MIEIGSGASGRLPRRRIAVRAAVLLATTALTSPLLISSAVAQNLPSGGSVAAGSAVISQPSATQLTITQSSQSAVVNFQSFSVGQGNSVTFAQPNASSAILNRVTGNASSNIAGSITANGSVYLVNPNGIAITSSGTVNVGGGFVASTLGISDSDFMSGKRTFTGNGASAAVSNEGAIRVGRGGYAALIGGTVSNAGSIEVPLGKVGLGSGEQATLDFSGDGFLQVAMPTKAGGNDALIKHSGTIKADGGSVIISAATAREAARNAVNISGTVQARSISGHNGSITIGGGEGGSVNMSGRVSASGRSGGGRVAVSGRVVQVAKGAIVRARSKTGQGGAVAITGDIVNNSGTVDASGASGGAIDVSGINIGSYGIWDVRGTSAAGGAFTATGSQSYVETTGGSVLASGATGGGHIAIAAPYLFSSGYQDATSAVGKGGRIEVTGEHVALVAATLDASGATGGGAVRIGGDFQGGGTLAHASTTTVSPATTIRADATQNGNGGSVVVWSDSKTDFYGTISARGGATGGDGGQIEVSSKADLVYGGLGDAGAATGVNGLVLLDPKNIVIDDATGTYPQYQLIDPLQGAGANQFGQSVRTLTGTGTTIVTAPGTTVGGNAKAGAVYLYDTVTGALISSLTGATANDSVGAGGVTLLGNDNYLISTYAWNGNRGAVTWGNGTTGASGVVDATNSLVGSNANDQVGFSYSAGVGAWDITLLGTGNYMVNSIFWNDNRGAVTWGNGATGVVGEVSATNSLVGSNANDSVGSGRVTLLGTGNYVVRSVNWNGNRGAVTWGSGTSGVVGEVSATNSLVGSNTGDQVGSGGVTLLGNGNYVVGSSAWNGTRGAVTWGSGTTGVAGAVSAANSLVGSHASDQVGYGYNGLTLLGNGDYVVSSPSWNGNRGAVTWGSGTSGISGMVDATNSLVGSNANDQIGFSGVTLLGNGNYVVSSPTWNGNRGAVTWVDGTSGTSGVVDASNSLVGSNAGDMVGNDSALGIYYGSGGVTALSNGNYVVDSPNWYGGRGAVTWGNGTSGISGVVGATNSLVGSNAGDQVGVDVYGDPSITALGNGNYVVITGNWYDGRGAVTWGNGALGISGTVDASNSLVGSHAYDQVGRYGLTLLGNGNYVVNSTWWYGGRGAVTWANGTSGTSGVVDASNSLVGSNVSDKVGSFSGVMALGNDNYVVNSPTWNGNRGAVTWGNGTSGTFGEVDVSNSLVGSNAGDQVGGGVAGYGGVTALGNGNYVVRSVNWNDNRGAVTWGNGATGVVGEVSAANSLVGSNAGDQVGYGYNGVTLLGNGNYVVITGNWYGGRGAVTWGSGTSGISGEIDATNSLVGSNAGDQVGYGHNGVTLLGNGNYVVSSSQWSGTRGAVTWGNGTSGTSGEVDATNSLVGSNVGDMVGSDGIASLGNGNYVVVSSVWNGNRGAVTWWGSGTAPVAGTVSAANSLVGAMPSTQFFFKGTGDTNDVFLAGSASDGGSGRVYVGLNDLNLLSYGRAMAQNVTIRTDAITRQLDTGSALTLQASNDITVNSAITVDNPTGDGGALTLQAGRSILVNAAITTDNGNLTLIGNDRLANGVVDAQRDPGAAVIALNAPIDAGTGAVDIQLRDGAGKTNSGGGDITLGPITAGTVSAVNSSLSGGLVLNGAVTASGGGDAIVLAANGRFVNNVGAGALSLSGGGRWLVYSNNPSAATFGNLDSGNTAIWNAAYSMLPPASVTQTGNRYLFAYQPTLTFTSIDLTKIYNQDASPALPTAYGISGLNAGVANAYLGDSLASVMSGAPTLASAGAAAAANVTGSPYTIAIAAGSVATSLGYLASFVSSGALTVNPAALTITASNQSKGYGDALSLGSTAFTQSGLVTANGDSIAGVTLASLGAASSANVAGAPYAITASNATGSGLANYTISYVDGALTVSPAALTITASNQGKSYGDALNLGSTAFTQSGLVTANGDSIAGVTLASLGAASSANVAGAPYAITASSATGSGLANYVISYVDGVLVVSPAALTITANAQARIAGTENPALTYQVNGTLFNHDTITGALTTSATKASTIGFYPIMQGTLAVSSNYRLTYQGALLNVAPVVDAALWASSVVRDNFYPVNLPDNASPVFGAPTVMTSLGLGVLYADRRFDKVFVCFGGGGGAAQACFAANP